MAITLIASYALLISNSVTVTQAENKVTKVEALVNNPATSTVHFYYNNNPIPASGGTATETAQPASGGYCLHPGSVAAGRPFAGLATDAG